MNLSDLNNLELRTAGSWPPMLKAIAMLLIMGAVVGASYYFFIKDQLLTLEQTRATEQNLRREFKEKYKIMANIDAYRAQLAEMRKMLDTMLSQLPTSTEMPDLLENISNTGKRNGLDFELFKPQNEQPREFYAVKPIDIKARASYHQFAAFVSNIAALPRIVTVKSAKLTDPKQDRQARGSNEESLLIEATLQTYRYMEDDESDDENTKGASRR